MTSAVDDKLIWNQMTIVECLNSSGSQNCPYLSVISADVTHHTLTLSSDNALDNCSLLIHKTWFNCTTQQVPQHKSHESNQDINDQE